MYKDNFIRLIFSQGIMYNIRIFISLSSWYWITAVPSKPGKNVRIMVTGIEVLVLFDKTHPWI